MHLLVTGGAIVWMLGLVKLGAFLLAYTIGDYLPCTGIKEGHYNTEGFFLWIGETFNPSFRNIMRAG